MNTTDEDNVIADVRVAKTWVDSQFSDFNALGEHLRAVEQAYRNRSGEYASLPLERPESVRAAIENAVDEPGSEFLNDVRRGKTA